MTMVEYSSSFRYKNLIILFSLSFFAFLPFIHKKAYATGTVDVEGYYVDYYVNKDSTVTVEEEMKLRLDGSFNELYRDITIKDEKALEKCTGGSTFQCGGFDSIYILEVTDIDGKVLDENEYKVSLTEVDRDGWTDTRIDVAFSVAGRTFNNEVVSWKIKYKVYGSLKFYSDYIFFYWDTATDVQANIKDSRFRIFLPEDISFNANNDLEILGYTNYIPEYNNKTITITPTGPISIYDDYTIKLKLPPDLAVEPGNVKVNPIAKPINLPFLSPEFALVIDDREIYSNGNVFKGLPAGQRSLTFKIKKIGGYDSDLINTDVNIKSGETVEVDVELPSDPVRILITILVLFCNCFGIILIPIGIVYPIYKWRTKGKDQGGRGTIVPWFSPPDNISPSLLGSLKDERVDLTDITSTIIDTAYRGYIKIKELDKKAKSFEFIKLKPFDDLKTEEKKIMDSIFGAEENVTTVDLKNKFYTKIKGIQDTIYDEMVTKQYFKKRPDKVRGENYGIGICSIIVAGLLGVGLAIPTAGISLLFVTFPAIAIGLFGIFTMIFAYAMPAKTPIGTDILEKVKGFRMYLFTAERFRMQKLTPEMFEKYLSYAIVFGIEKEWAEKFKDIYKGHPDWYEGSDPTRAWTPIYIANALHSMNTVTSHVISSQPQSSHSGWSGGGWSGGGGFSGGFSGGGGGGGGFGAR